MFSNLVIEGGNNMKKIKKLVTALITLSLVLSLLVLPASSAYAYSHGNGTLQVEEYDRMYAFASTSSYYGYCSVGLQVTVADANGNYIYSNGTQGYSDTGYASCSLPAGGDNVISSALSYHWSSEDSYMGINWSPANGYSYFY